MNAYFQASASSVFPTYFAPVIGCKVSGDHQVQPNMATREELVGFIFPELLGQMGAQETPGISPKGIHSFLCSEMLSRADAESPGWNAAGGLKKYASKALEGRTESSVVFMLAAIPHRCEDIFEDVYDPDGQRVVGKIKRGRRCYEGSRIMLVLALVTREGELVWFSTGRSDDATYDDLLRDWPGPRGSEPVALG